MALVLAWQPAWVGRAGNPLAFRSKSAQSEKYFDPLFSKALSSTSSQYKMGNCCSTECHMSPLVTNPSSASHLPDTHPSHVVPQLNQYDPIWGSTEPHISPLVTSPPRAYPSHFVRQLTQGGPRRPLRCTLLIPYHRGEPIVCNHDGVKMVTLLLLIHQRLILFDDGNNAIDCLLFVMQVVRGVG